MQLRTTIAIALVLLLPNAQAGEEPSGFVGVVDLPKVRAQLEFKSPPKFVLRIEHPRKAVYSTDERLSGRSRHFTFGGRKTVGSATGRIEVLEYTAANGSPDRIWIRANVTKAGPDLLSDHEIDRAPYCLVYVMCSKAYEIPFNRKGTPASEQFRSTALLRFQVAGLWGYMDPRSEKFVIPPRFQIARPFWFGRAAVKCNGRFGFIDHKGTLVVPAKYDACSNFGAKGEPGLAVVTVGRRKGMVAADGRLLIPARYDDFPSGFVGGITSTRVFGRGLGLIDRTGRVVATPQFDRVGCYSEGLIAVTQFMRSQDRTGYLDRKGELVIPFRYRSGGAFRNGLAPVQLGSSKWAYIDRLGATKIAGNYDHAREFWNGLAVVGIGESDSRSGQFRGKYGCVGTSGKRTIPVEYDWIEGFIRGDRCAAVRDGAKGWLEKDGRFEKQ